MMTAKSLQDNSGVAKEEAPDLRDIREAHGLTLEDIFRATKISVSNLEAMETGAFHSLPPPVYSRSFFKAYAKLLAVDETLVLGNYEKYLASFPRQVEEKEEAVPRRQLLFPKKIVLKVSIFTILGLSILGFFTYIYFHLQVADVATDGPLPIVAQGRPTPDEGVEPDAPANTAVSAPQPAESGPLKDRGEGEEGQPGPVSAEPKAVKREGAPTTGTKNPPGKPALLVIRAREKTWLRITEDQKTPYQLLMQPGEKVERSAGQFVLDIGNAGGVVVEFEGTIMNSLGKSGEVVHLRLP